MMASKKTPTKARSRSIKTVKGRKTGWETEHQKKWPTGKAVRDPGTFKEFAKKRTPMTDESGEVRELDAQDFAKFRPASEVDPEIVKAAKRRGRPPLDTTKKQITLRLDAEIIEHFKADGPGWQTRLNDVLAQHIKHDVLPWSIKNDVLGWSCEHVEPDWVAEDHQGVPIIRRVDSHHTRIFEKVTMRLIGLWRSSESCERISDGPSLMYLDGPFTRITGDQATENELTPVFVDSSNFKIRTAGGPATKRVKHKAGRAKI